MVKSLSTTLSTVNTVHGQGVVCPLTVVHGTRTRVQGGVGKVGWELFCLKFTLHAPRHEAISRMFEKGLNVPEVASISGHKTASQLFRYIKVNIEVL